jgi:DNA-binding transcriptional ArsR family regulator
LRSLAHPVRLRMLSLLTGAPMSAAEVARELGLTHANASYHLRQLLAAGQLVEAGEESIRGGRAKRYRYDLSAPGSTAQHPGQRTSFFQALAAELVRRVAEIDPGRPQTSTDAELWVLPEAWTAFREAVSAASTALHEAARAPRTDGTWHVSATMSAFVMSDQPGRPS